MIGPVLVDTGPLVAILSRSDEHHNACVAQLRSIAPPLLTCWPVITEAVWLLRHHPAAIQRLLGSFDAGLLRLLVLEQEAISWIASFVERYRTLRAQVADAALVYLAEREGIGTIFTLDRRDFSLYRISRGRRLSLIPA